MTPQKSLLVDLAETIARHQPQQPASKTPGWLRWFGRQLFPNLGSVLLVLILLSTFPGLAASLNSINATSISTIPYQGRLADASGNPVTGKQNMEFRIYNVPIDGTPLWEEFWTGANSVDVSDGLFSVMLGSINTGLTAVVQGNNDLYLGITVGTDTEMTPRVQLGSVPFSIWSLTVADDSITTSKLSDGAVTTAKLAPDAVAAFEGRTHSYPYVVHMRHFFLLQGSYCFGYVPGDPEQSRPECMPYPGLDRFTQGLNLLASSGSGHIASANNAPISNVDLVNQTVSRLPRWGYAYTFFLTNPGSARFITLPVGTCNDVAIYVSAGDVVINTLGNDVSLQYHRFPGSSNEDTGCPCNANLNPTLQLPAGNFRLTLLTRGAGCTSYLGVGNLDAQGLAAGNWIQDAGLTIDWAGLRTYLGEY